MRTEFFNLVIATLCCASISFTITTSGIFKWMRDLVSLIHPKAEDLIHCPWCIGHWILLGYMLVTKEYSGFEAVVMFFVTTSLMGLIHYVLLRAYEPVAKMKLQRKIDKLKEHEN